MAEIRSHLATLRLKQMAEILDDELAIAARDAVPPVEVVRRLLSAESRAATDRRIVRRVAESQLPEHLALIDYDFAFQTGVDRTQVMELASLSFVERKQSLIIAGNSGTGKSHIAKAILLLGCKNQYRCLYTTAADMLRKLLSGLCDGSLPEKLKLYVNPEILLIDELGLDRLEQESARNSALFHKVIEGRYGKLTTLVTTNVDFADLGAYLGDPVATVATVDRMVHHSIILNIQGPSWRMHQSKIINQSKPKATDASPKVSKAK